jgi:hypothetical protein
LFPAWNNLLGRRLFRDRLNVHSVCSVFHHKPCLPYCLPPIGQDLRLTIVSTDENASQAENGDVITGRDHALDSIRDMFAALTACWLPPPKDEARHGMEYTVRFALKRDGTMIAAPRMTYSSHGIPGTTRDIYRVAIDAAFKRCIPLHFSAGMAGAVAGRRHSSHAARPYRLGGLLAGWRQHSHRTRRRPLGCPASVDRG